MPITTENKEGQSQVEKPRVEHWHNPFINKIDKYGYGARESFWEPSYNLFKYKPTYKETIKEFLNNPIKVEREKIKHTKKAILIDKELYVWNVNVNKGRWNSGIAGDSFERSETGESDVQYNEISITIDLAHIYKKIDESKYLLSLEDDWDEDGAIPVPRHIYERATKILLDYSSHVLQWYDKKISAPHISAGKSGSIDLHWKTPKAELLISIINSDNYEIHYYGDDTKNNKVIKAVLKEMSVDEDLAHWMRKL